MGTRLILVLLFLSAALGAVTGCAAARPPEPSRGVTEGARLEQQVLELVNRHRRGLGLGALSARPVIADAARSHSRAMAARGELSHDDFRARIAPIRTALPLRGAGENVGMNNGYVQPAQAVVDGWLGSPGHRGNIEGDFDATGVGVVRDTGGSLWFTQIFVRTR